MVEIKNDSIVITIPNDDPAEFLHGLQTGIIEMVKSLLSIGEVERDLVLDEETSEGCVCALELVQATLIDPKQIQAAQELAARVMPPPNQV